MNADQNWQEQPPEPDIIIIGIERANYYLYKGEDYLNQLLLVDGDFPRPVLCVHFDSVFDVKLMLGKSVNISSYWGINPAIIDRLRNDAHLVETDA